MSKQVSIRGILAMVEAMDREPVDETYLNQQRIAMILREVRALERRVESETGIDDFGCGCCEEWNDKLNAILGPAADAGQGREVVERGHVIEDHLIEDIESAVHTGWPHIEVTSTEQGWRFRKWRTREGER